MSKKLVILTTHFGTNFSGGSTATCEIFSRIERNFDEVIVVGNELGQNPFNSINFLNYNSWWQALKILRDIDTEDTVFYGDFYNSILYVWLNIPFYFTYHDNWPEIETTSIRNRIRSLFYTNVYKQIFKNAITVFTVSDFKSLFVKKCNEQVHLVRNGFNRANGLEFRDEQIRILMVGNIDNRKYRLALPLFRLLEKERSFNISIDIYGNIIDDRLADKINKFSFVNLKGFHNSVPYKRYKLLLHTSLMENLSIVFCESIYNGLPILGFDVGGAKEIVSSNTGVLIAAYKIETMKVELLKMLAGPPKVKHDITDLDEYSWDKASMIYLNEMVG